MEEKVKEIMDKEKIESVAAVEQAVDAAVDAAVEPVASVDAAKEEIVPEDVKNLNPSLDKWKPRTKLGKEVMEGKWDIRTILQNGMKIKEFQIVDKLMPDLGNEIIYIGGSPGKGGGS